MTVVPMISVRPEQGPPMAVPFSFFFTGPLALVVAGALVLTRIDDGINTLWAPSNVALVHLGVVGLLTFTMTGALYQMLPVVAGALVPAPRLAHVVHVLLVVGAVSLVYGQAYGPAGAFLTAIISLTLAALLFLGPAGYALLRSPVTGPTATGMKLALLSLAVLVWAGSRLAATRAGATFDGQWLTLRYAHAHLGFLCWVGGLITAVSWQVLPMFFLVASPPRAVAWTVFAGLAASLVGLGVATVVPMGMEWVKWLALPGAIAVWLVQPGWAVWALLHRRRKRRDATSWFWWFSMAAGPACFGLGAACVFLDSPKWPVIYGLCVVWAWAGALVHGMLTRIAPFLVWLHRCAPHVGKAKVPSAKELLTDREVSVGFAIHVASVLAGVVAVWTGEMLAWRVFGGTLALTGLAVAWELFTTVRRGRVSITPG